MKQSNNEKQLFATPILFIVFNRLETTKKVFAQIRKAKPTQLFIGADGARVGKLGEAQKVRAVRQYILDNIDWDCEVKTLFREQNLGCGKAVSGAITWFFNNVEQGIILEDDVLPDDSFFPFCAELLERYKQNPEVYMIAGYNKAGKVQDGYSYGFLQSPTSIWGWATWRRAWAEYDMEMKSYPNFDWDTLNHLPQGRKKAYKHNLDLTFTRNIDTWWDYQWAFTILNGKGYGIACHHNLIKNLGFHAEATHTASWELQVYEPDVYQVSFPLQHPKAIEHNTNLLQKMEEERLKQQEGIYSRRKLWKIRLQMMLSKILSIFS
ncbi:MAG: nucleotide-diphospho-sugar transferase [Bacteroidetes bacterium]|nr:MAG: nucleotide-diphospho-sugar transferase [Bacteroidota bacterium]